MVGRTHCLVPGWICVGDLISQLFMGFVLLYLLLSTRTWYWRGVRCQRLSCLLILFLLRGLWSLFDLFHWLRIK